MLQSSLFLLTTSALLVQAFPQENLKNNENNAANQRPYFYLIEQSLDDQAAAAQTQTEEKVKSPLQSQQVYQPGGYGIQYLEPQFQYPVYNQQAFPRIQPSFLYYGAGGQGQPILINPGSPPGNFLIPQQPGTNIFLRGNPQTPMFVGGYPNPKPAHIPPIEKDAEEIPTNPANIPPLPTSNPEDKKPEKLETFNEDSIDLQPKTVSEADVLAEADRNPQAISRNNLKPGQRFFILNGEPLYQNYPIYQVDPNEPLQQDDQPFQQLQDIQRPQGFNYNVPPNLLLRNIPSFNEQPLNTNPVQGTSELNQQKADSNQESLQNGQRYTQSFVPLSLQNLPQEGSPRGNLPGFIQLPQDGYFRSNLQSSEPSRIPIGQFRFSPPNAAYFPFGDDAENDAVVVNANFEEDTNANTKLSSQSDIVLPAPKSTEPSTAQASPGAVALAGPGGTAGAAPKATALVGNGGLAVSSPRATAIAGTKDEEKNKEPKEKQEKEKKSTKKTKN